jgi:hypothetical protein
MNLRIVFWYHKYYSLQSEISVATNINFIGESSVFLFKYDHNFFENRLSTTTIPTAAVREEDEEEDEDDLSFSEFLEELDVKQADEVPPADLQAGIAASFETHRQERGRATTTEEVILLESAIEASTGGDTEHED